MNDMDKLYKFMSNMDMKSGHVSNVYVARTYDTDGNCTGEAYGMNLMTDYGFQQFYGQDDSVSVTFPTKLYVGEGTTSFDKTTQTMLSVLFDGLAASTSGYSGDTTTPKYDYPLYYAPGDQSDNGVITTVTRYMVVHYPENITNITSDVAISEYGIGTAYTALWTHSFVYDLQGDRAVLIKRPNERLVIEVFICCTYSESLIIDGWSNGIYNIMTTGRLMLQRMAIPDAKTYRRYNYSGTSGLLSRTIAARAHTAIVDSTITKTVTLGTIVMVPGNVDGYIDGFAFSTDGFLSLQPQQLTTPIAFVTDKIYSHDPFDLDGFADTFGRDVPVTQFNITSVDTYNYHTGEWSEHQYFNNDPNHLYDETPMGINCAVPIYYNNNGTIEALYLYQNLNTTDPILSFKGNIETIYATDKYWNGPNLPTDSWYHITNRLVLPPEAQTKRYYITNTNVTNLEPVRQGRFYVKLTDDSDGVVNTPSRYITINGNTGALSLTNTDYNVAIIYANRSNGSKINFFAIDDNWVETVDVGVSTYMIFTYGKYVVIDKGTAGILIYDISTLSQHYLDPPITLASTTAGRRCDTHSGTGIICVSSVSAHTNIEIIDLRQSTPTTTSIANSHGAVIWNTSRVAYVTPMSGTSKKLHIYDVDTGQDVSVFDVPAAMSGEVHHLIGHGDTVYLISSDQTYLCNITTGVFTESPTKMNMSNSGWGPYIDCSSDLIFIHGDQAATSNMMYPIAIHTSNPTLYRDFTYSMIGAASSSPTYESKVGSQVQFVGNSALVMSQIYKTNDNQLWLTFVDLGLFARTGNTDVNKLVKEPGLYFAYDKHLIAGGTMIPLINFLPIKITGTTKTITAINGNIGLNNKQFMLTFTNKPAFSGKPPGQQN